MGPIIWLPNGTIKVRPSHSLSHYHIASNPNHFNCADHLIVFNPLIKKKFQLSFSLNNRSAIHLSWCWGYKVMSWISKYLLFRLLQVQISDLHKCHAPEIHIFLYHLWMKIFFYIICGLKYFSISFVDENMECDFVLR